MPYTPKTDWQYKDTVQHDDMNRIEQGIVDAATAAESALQALAQTGDTAAEARQLAEQARATADLAVDAGLVVEAVLPVEGAEPEQVQTTAGPAVQFAADKNQAVTFCRRWPFAGEALHMELVVAASEADLGTFRVLVGYRINGGTITNVVKAVTPGATTGLYVADLGEIIPAASLPTGALMTITLSRIGSDAADTHPGAMLVYQCRLKRG